MMPPCPISPAAHLPITGDLLAAPLAAA
jgi:hypothetical protein